MPVNIFFPTQDGCKLVMDCSLLFRLIVILLGGALFGCSGDASRFTLSGAVSYDGQQVANGNIGFVPVSESGEAKAVGADVVDGRYEVPRHEGPLAGTYKVVIYAEKPGSRMIRDEGSSEMVAELVQYIPEVYNAGSTLMVDISEDRDDLNFDLEKPKPTKRGRR